MSDPPRDDEPAMDDPRPVAIAAVLRSRDGRYLLIRRGPAVPAPGYWTPVTGRPEPGESLRDAVRRECAEELALPVRVGAEVYRCPTADERWVLVWYEAEAEQEDAPLRLQASEVAEARWVTAAEACALEPMFPGTRRYFERLAHGGSWA